MNNLTNVIKENIDYTDIKLFANYITNNNETNIDMYDYCMIYGYIYLIVLPDTRYYIGQKKYHPNKSKKYYGSGNHIRNIIKKETSFNSNNLPKQVAELNCIQKQILDVAFDQDELDFLERYYIKRARLFESFDNQCLNIHDGGSGSYYKPPGKFILNENSIKKALETKRKRAAMGLYKISDETRMKRSIGIKKALQVKPIWNKGLTKETDERVRKMSDNVDRSYLTNPEYRNKISKATKGLLWFNNGKINIRIKDTNNIPEGFIPGMLGKKNNNSVCRRCMHIKTKRIFESIEEAANFYNCTVHSILKSCENNNHVSSRSGKYIGRFTYIMEGL